MRGIAFKEKKLMLSILNILYIQDTNKIIFDNTQNYKTNSQSILNIVFSLKIDYKIVFSL